VLIIVGAAVGHADLAAAEPFAPAAPAIRRIAAA